MTVVTSRRGHAVVRRPAFGTDAVLVVSDPLCVARADEILQNTVEAVDRTCSRFRSDSEIEMLHDHPGEWMYVSDLLFEALVVALDAAQSTGGAVDPTVGTCMAAIGYDRDFAALEPDGPVAIEPAPGWRAVGLDHGQRRARVAPGVHLDLGASAKAFAADRIAGAVAALGTGVLVSLGGDIATDGAAPDAGWPVGIADESAGSALADQVVAIHAGALATSSTTSRTWHRGGAPRHHIVDPRTGNSAPSFWRLVTVAAESCVRANALSTASVVWGADAVRQLVELRVAARLVRGDGAVVTTPGWPA